MFIVVFDVVVVAAVDYNKVASDPTIEMRMSSRARREVLADCPAVMSQHSWRDFRLFTLNAVSEQQPCALRLGLG